MITFALHHQLKNPDGPRWRILTFRLIQNTEKGRPHRVRGNLKGLQNVGPNPQRQNDRDQSHLRILFPTMVPLRP